MTNFTGAEPENTAEPDPPTPPENKNEFGAAEANAKQVVELSDSPAHPTEDEVGEKTEETGPPSQNENEIGGTSTDIGSNLGDSNAVRKSMFKQRSSHPSDQIISDLSKGVQTRNSVWKNFCAY